MKTCTDKEYELIQLIKNKSVSVKLDTDVKIWQLMDDIQNGDDPELEELDRIKKMIELSIIDTETMKLFNRRTYGKD